MKSPPESTKQMSDTTNSAPMEPQQVSELMEALLKENRAHMADFLEAMRLRDDFAVRIGQRTTQIIRFSLVALVVISVALIALMLTLIVHMTNITDHMNDMTGHIAGMHSDFNQVTVSVHNMDNRLGIINNQLGSLTQDVNTMSSPMRLMPFRP
jgi:hypothetical protein